MRYQACFTMAVSAAEAGLQSLVLIRGKRTGCRGSWIDHGIIAQLLSTDPLLFSEHSEQSC